MFSLSMGNMPIAFYFLKVRGDGEAALKSVRNLRGSYAVDYAALVFGKYDMLVKVSGAHQNDVVRFWFDIEREVSGASVEQKCFSPMLPERKK